LKIIYLAANLLPVMS